MPLLRGLYTCVTLTWGFTVRYREASAAQPALPIPPPTTVVGAFAYPLLRALGVDVHHAGSERYFEHRLITPIMKCLLEATLSASASLVPGWRAVGLIVHQEPSRLIAAPYGGGESWRRAMKSKPFTEEFYKKGISKAMGVRAVGSAYGPGAVLELMWVFDLEKLSRRLRVKPEDIDRVGEEAAHGVVRIGSKEGLVAVDHYKSLYDKNVKVLGPGSVFETRFYVEKDCVTPRDSKNVNEVTLWDLTGKLRPFYIASRFASNNVVVPTDEVPKYRLIVPCQAYTLSNNVTCVGRAVSFLIF